MEAPTNGDGRRPPKLLRLPERGRLLVCTDLHGNLRDFAAAARHFEAARASEPDTHIVFAGDFVHGPELSRDEWVDDLGAFYEDQSPALVEALIDLRARHPGRVHALLGNHEHAHVGGACTAKFSDDEAHALESRMSPDAITRMRALLQELPLVAVAPAAGLVITHAAPSVPIAAPEDIDAVRYVDEGWASMTFVRWMMRAPVLAALLWSRSCSPRLASRFVEVLTGRAEGVAIYGHVVVREGYEIAGEGEQLVLSTSFGLHDADKRYLDVPLSRPWQSAHDLHAHDAIRRLYPDA